MQVRLSHESRNGKTGPISVSTTESASCWPGCPFLNNGCYAKSWPLNQRWKEVDDGKAGTGWDTFCQRVATEIPAGALWRHNQAGDLPGKGGRIDRAKLRKLVQANTGKRGFTYTHKPMTETNRQAVKEANEAGFTINLSGNSPRHADVLAELEIGPVVTVLPADHADKTSKTPAGRTIVTCPATYRDDVTCKTCQLCQRKRQTIVGFPAHGVSKRKASDIASS